MSEYSDIRPDIREALDAWAGSARPVGGFLAAVLTNDLFGALGRADADNRAALFTICDYVYNELPSICWGSKEKVAAWAQRIAAK